MRNNEDRLLSRDLKKWKNEKKIWEMTKKEEILEEELKKSRTRTSKNMKKLIIRRGVEWIVKKKKKKKWKTICNIQGQIWNLWKYYDVFYFVKRNLNIVLLYLWKLTKLICIEKKLFTK